MTSVTLLCFTVGSNIGLPKSLKDGETVSAPTMSALGPFSRPRSYQAITRKRYVLHRCSPVIAVRAHATIPQQVAGVLMAKQVLAGGHRPRIELGQRRLQREVQGIANLLVPEQRILAQHLGVSDALLQRQAPVRIDRELSLAIQLLQHSLDAGLVLGDAVADLHLDHVVSAIEIAPHLGPQFVEAFARVIVTARGINEDPW